MKRRKMRAPFAKHQATMLQTANDSLTVIASDGGPGKPMRETCQVLSTFLEGDTDELLCKIPRKPQVEKEEGEIPKLIQSPRPAEDTRETENEGCVVGVLPRT